MFADRAVGRRAFTLGALATTLVHAKGRTAVGGKITLRVPWPTGGMDPHRMDDALAAFFGEAVFDTLFAADGNGAFVPGLADGEPEIEGVAIKVKLRLGLKTAREKNFGTKDAVFAIARARAAGARGWLGDIPVPREDGRSLYFTMKDPAASIPRLKAALAAPIVSMTPLGFSPETPDGTGPFRYAMRDGSVTLTRNRSAARGPAYLDEVVLRSAASVSASLLAFEAGTDDIGWFERGLHEPRAGSKSFDFGAVGWAVLFTGKDANDWNGPGVAQRIADGIPYARVSSLHLGAPWAAEPPLLWGGPPTTLLVRDDAPWLIEVANVIAATISQPSHEVTVKSVPASEIASRRASRSFGIVLDLVRRLEGTSLGAAVAMATANDPSSASSFMQHAPKLGDVSPRTLTRMYRCGVIGEVKMAGGRVPDLLLAPSLTGFGVDLGASYRTRK